jgi:hypothetical protein
MNDRSASVEEAVEKKPVAAATEPAPAQTHCLRAGEVRSSGAGVIMS